MQKRWCHLNVQSMFVYIDIKTIYAKGSMGKGG